MPISNHLKNSLSETLYRFYPLASRLVDNLYVECNDTGALFAEAETDCHLSQVITNPDPETIKKLFCNFDDSHDFCMTIQATFFRCGSLALGLLISHKLVDGVSLITFANSWSAVARNGSGETRLPIFNAATHFPLRDIPHFNPNVGITEEELARRIFTFPAGKIDALREKYAALDGGGDHGRRPSRVDAVSVYLWTRLLLATGRQADSSKTYSIKHTVNLRSRVEPPMSEYHLGNISWVSIAKPAAEDGEAEVVRKIREGKKGLYEGYTRELKELNVLKELMSEGEQVVSFMFTRLCGISLYETDFGWGKPI